MLVEKTQIMDQKAMSRAITRISFEIIERNKGAGNLQNEYFMHANYDPVAYFAHRNKVYPPAAPGETYEPMSLTYQPLTLQEKGLDKLGGIRYKTKWYPNGATTQAMYLTVMHRPDDNGLDFNFEHQVKAVSREQLEYLYYYLCKIMFKGAENPDLPIGDIIKLI